VTRFSSNKTGFLRLEFGGDARVVLGSGRGGPAPGTTQDTHAIASSRN
jgi:hypothetical protein